LFALHRHGHAGRDSDYVNGSASLKNGFGSDSAECMSTRQSRYETVGDGSDEGNRSHWIVLFCQRYWLAGVGGRGSWRRALGGQDSPTWIEISLVFVTIMLRVLTYVVSNRLFWNWNGVVRFVSQEFWFDKGFVIWNFRNYCSVQIVSLWSLSLGVQIIFTSNESVDRIRNLKWNASPND